MARRWEVSELPIATGAQLLICGPPDSVDWFRGLTVADKRGLWERAGRDYGTSQPNT